MVAAATVSDGAPAGRHSVRAACGAGSKKRERRPRPLFYSARERRRRRAVLGECGSVRRSGRGVAATNVPMCRMAAGDSVCGGEQGASAAAESQRKPHLFARCDRRAGALICSTLRQSRGAGSPTAYDDVYIRAGSRSCAKMPFAQSICQHTGRRSLYDVCALFL